MLVNTRRAVLAGLGALPLVLAACGGDDGAASVTTVVIDTTDFATIPPVESTIPPESTVPPAGEQQYTVQSGDVLVNIAKSFGVTAEEIASYNGWTDGTSHLIFSGMVIKIPPGGATATSTGTGTTTTVGGATTTTLAGGGDNGAEGSYTVQDGDTLSGIAGKFDVTVDQLVAANGWTDGSSHLIYSGMVIKIPAKTT